MEAWGRIITTITTIPPFPTNQRQDNKAVSGGCQGSVRVPRVPQGLFQVYGFGGSGFTGPGALGVWSLGFRVWFAVAAGLRRTTDSQCTKP